MSKKPPLVLAIVGRPNVGKSSLVNKIIGRREAIVHDLPGVTRDRNYYQTEWNTKPLIIIDTGGIYNDNAANDSISFQKEIEEQVQIALRESDVIIFLVDGKEGLHPLDREIATLLRKTQKKVLVAVNKMETSKRDLNVYDFYNLGYETIHRISAITGQGVSDILDEVIPSSEIKVTPEKELLKPIKIAIVGKPNAGKSSLLNVLIGKDRAIVSPIAGTTRDIIDEEVQRENTLFKFIDTAGIRKKAKVFEDIEYYSVTRAIHAIEQCDIAILLLDAEKLVEEQDQKIAGIIEKNNKGCIIAINKWDLIAKDSTTINDFEESVRQRLKFLKYCPVMFISAKEMTRTYEIYKEAITIHANYNFRTTTSAMNKVIKTILDRSPATTHKGRPVKIYYATQTASQPPTFTFFVNKAELVHFSYKRYLENQLRLELPLAGTPIRLNFRSKVKKNRKTK